MVYEIYIGNYYTNNGSVGMNWSRVDIGNGGIYYSLDQAANALLKIRADSIRGNDRVEIRENGIAIAYTTGNHERGTIEQTYEDRNPPAPTPAPVVETPRYGIFPPVQEPFIGPRTPDVSIMPVQDPAVLPPTTGTHTQNGGAGLILLGFLAWGLLK